MKKFDIHQDKLSLFLSKIYDNPINGWDTNKGFILLGSTGIGKTSSCRKFFSESEMESEKGNGKFNKMYYFDSFDLTRDHINNASSCDYWLFIDDLGTEPQFRNHFGTQESPVLETLLRRANNMEKYSNSRGKVFATSNKSLEQLNEFYGPRLYSRLNTLFNVVIVSGELDHRQSH